MPARPLLAVSGMGAAILVAALALAPVPDGAPLPAPPGFSPAPAPSPRGRHTLTLHGDEFGQFWARGRVNGVAYRFLVDTGAGDISFGLEDARRLGFDPGGLVFDGLASTANGTMRTAHARVAWLQVGPFLLRDVPVSIGEGDMGEPLLGMSFLRRFHLAIRNDSLTIRE